MEKLVRTLIYGISRMPFFLLYGFSDFLFFISFYLLKYRRKVVEDNLRHAFPELSEKERQKISRQFFRELADLVLETIKLLTISPEVLKKRCRLADSPGVKHFFKQKNGAMLLTGHFANWEWAGQIIGLSNPEKPVHVVYLKLKNKMFNDIMHRLRSRFGNVPVHMEQAFRHIYNHRAEGIVSCFLADQTPQPHQIGLWTPFFHRMTPYFTGPEKIAVRLEQNVYFGYVRKLRRGYYEIEIELITDQPTHVPELYITETYVRMLENAIRERPSAWLWSHRRWKHDFARHGDKGAVREL